MGWRVRLCFDELEFSSTAAVAAGMGCGGSKVDDLPLVVLCRERKELIRAAADHRYALSAAHISYFRSLKDVGDALCRFVDEELVNASGSASPVLTLPSDRGKPKKMQKQKVGGSSNTSGGKNKSSSSTPSISHSESASHIHSIEDDEDTDDGHLHLPSDSDSDSDMRSPGSGHIHLHDNSDSPQVEAPSFSPLPHTDWDPYGMYQSTQGAWGPYGAYPPSYQPGWDHYGGNSTSNAYYMKKSSPAVRTVIHGEEPRGYTEAGSLTGPSYGYSSSNSYENAGFFGFPMSSPAPARQENRKSQPPAGAPPPPSPKASTWDFLNPFEAFDTGYMGYYPRNGYGYGSIASSPDSAEVREREGIPELEEETENEVFRGLHKGKKFNKDVKKSTGEGSSRIGPLQKGEGTSGAVPMHSSEGGGSRPVPKHNSEDSLKTIPSTSSDGSSKAVPLQKSETILSDDIKEEKSSPDTIVSRNLEDENVRKKGVSFDIDEASIRDAESSKLSSLTTLSVHGTRDIREVANEIRDEFEVASNYGKEVALLLEVGKLPYQPNFTKAILSKILSLIVPSSSYSHPPSKLSVKLAFRTMKLAKSYYGDTLKDIDVKFSNLSSTLEKLYVWEKKLYKEVKDEERLRIAYEKKCRRLKALDAHGAESSKIDAAGESIRKLLTKLNVCVKAIDAISSRIHKLRDEELQPQVTDLIYGFIRMWKAMLKCHQKQFQAVLESKIRTLRANTSFLKDSSLRATLDLEMELLAWCGHFNDWINSQKSYVESLNGWLLRCLHHEPEVTSDGIVPFSPGRIGAPPIFIICNDWYQAMEAISETRVATAMRNFASSLRLLWERQDEEQRQRLKADYISKDFEKRNKTLKMERWTKDHEHDTISDKANGSIVPSENGDPKVVLDSMRQKLDEERSRHSDAVKLVHDAASSSLQGGLVPIFKALENFTSEALKAHEQIRILNAQQGL